MQEKNAPLGITGLNIITQAIPTTVLTYFNDLALFYYF